jgi:hypothetical protein
MFYVAFMGGNKEIATFLQHFSTLLPCGRNSKQLNVHELGGFNPIKGENHNA